jgi:hypothetical protein
MMMATGFGEGNKSRTLDSGEGRGIDQGEARRKAEPEAIIAVFRDGASERNAEGFATAERDLLETAAPDSHRPWAPPKFSLKTRKGGDPHRRSRTGKHKGQE